MRRVSVGLLLLICAVAIADPTTPAPEPQPQGVHFSHADHSARHVDIDKCETCHAVDAAGKVSAPAAMGHAPCLNSGCHASYFLAVGAQGKKADPAAYNKATQFCLGCHDSKDGSPPLPWKKPTTDVVFRSFQLEREYHVEMNHFEHVKKALNKLGPGDKCRACHVVDDKTFALVKDSPGHAQCVICHNTKSFPDFAMDKCGVCHSRPARADYFPKVELVKGKPVKDSRVGNDVRVCGSEGEQEWKKLGKRAQSCFRHERAEHRTLDGVAVQCDACHYMVSDQSTWQPPKVKWQSLLDLHTHKIIDNDRDREHNSCGRIAACHKRDVDEASNGGRCGLCHANQSAF